MDHSLASMSALGSLCQQRAGGAVLRHAETRTSESPALPDEGSGWRQCVRLYRAVLQSKNTDEDESREESGRLDKTVRENGG